MSSPDPAERGVATGGLTEAAVQGARWVGISRLAAEAASFAGMITLARLLPPVAFGQAVIAMLVNSLAYGLAYEGFGYPLVQRRDLGLQHVRTASALSLATGVFGTLLSVAASYWLVPGLFDDETAELVRYISPVFLVASVSAVSTALLQRRLDFRALALSELAGIVGGIATSVILAAAGAGAKALVLGPLAGAVLSAVLISLVARPPLPRLDRAAIREIARLGVPAQLAGLAWTMGRNIDYAILAARLGPTSTGYYWRAYQLGVEYQNKLGVVALRIAFPVYSRSADQAHMNRARRRLMRSHVAVAFPALTLLAVLAPVIVPLVFGERWTPAVDATRWLAVAGMIVAVNLGIWPVLFAAGRPTAVFGANLFFLAVFAPTVFFTAPHGIEAVAIAAIMVNAVFGLLCVRLLLRPLGTTERQILSDIAPPALCAVVLAGVVYGINAGLDALSVPELPAALVSSAVGLCVYAALLRRVALDLWEDFALLVRSARRS